MKDEVKMMHINGFICQLNHNRSLLFEFFRVSGFLENREACKNTIKNFASNWQMLKSYTP